jgi:hypothetical protein
VDATNGNVYATWSNLSGAGTNVYFSSSTDTGLTWSDPIIVNLAPAANTAVFPWVAANSGTVDVVYYGTSAASKDDPSTVWNVYLARRQTTARALRKAW